MSIVKMSRRNIILFIWLCFLTTALYFYFFQAGYVKKEFSVLSSLPLVVSGSIYLLLGCIRGFTLIPSTSLIVLGLIFLPAWPLYFLTVIGIMVSSLLTYYFSEYLDFDKFFEKKYSKTILKFKTSLEKRELPIVILWSAAPFFPTDIICYVCGTLKVNVYKFLLAVLVGEGIVCFIYIFLGKSLLAFFKIHSV